MDRGQFAALAVLLAVGSAAPGLPSLPDFPDAQAELEQSVREHQEQCTAICGEQQFFCGPVAGVQPDMDAYPMGSPSVDFLAGPWSPLLSPCARPGSGSKRNFVRYVLRDAKLRNLKAK